MSGNDGRQVRPGRRELIQAAIDQVQHGIPGQPQNPITLLHLIPIFISITVALIIIVYQLQAYKSVGSNPINKQSHEELLSSYDYIIVGGGTAGIILAMNIASHDTYPSVLLIEAGSTLQKSLMSPFIIPAYALYNNGMQDSIRNVAQDSKSWQYLTEKQKFCCKNYNDHQLPFVQGRGIGGTSLLSHMIWDFGHAQDFNSWINDTGNENVLFTDYETDILPFYKLLEDMTIDEILVEYGTLVEEDDNHWQNLMQEDTKQMLKERKQSFVRHHAQKLNKYFPKILTNILSKKKKQISDKSDYDVSEYRGMNGAIEIRRASKYSMVNAFILSAIKAGYKYNVDKNNHNLSVLLRSYLQTEEEYEKNRTEEERILGIQRERNREQNVDLPGSVSFQQFSIDSNGKRVNIYDSYLDRLSIDIKSKMNLHILTNTLVNKILFSNEKKNGKHKAIGIQFVGIEKQKELQFDEVLLNMESDAEVIVSAGVIGSPKLLMLSGFGNESKLQDLDIHVIEDMPDIGQHLKDQVLFDSYFKVSQRYKIMIAKNLESYVEKFVYLWKNGHNTILNSSGYDASMYWKYDGQEIETDSADIQFLFFNGIDDDFQKRNIIKSASELECGNSSIWNETGDVFGVTIKSILLHPITEGYIELRSDNVLDAPIIQPNYLSDDRDLEILKQSFYELNRVFNIFNNAEKDNNVNSTRNPFHTITDGYLKCKKYFNGNDRSIDGEVVERFIRDNIYSNHNSIGTCKMGVVVDSQFRLRNTQNVRVVDSSVIPHMISGGIQATVMMLAEKASHVILNDVKSILSNSEVNDETSEEFMEKQNIKTVKGAVLKHPEL